MNLSHYAYKLKGLLQKIMKFYAMHMIWNDFEMIMKLYVT